MDTRKEKQLKKILEGISYAKGDLDELSCNMVNYYLTLHLPPVEAPEVSKKFYDRVKKHYPPFLEGFGIESKKECSHFIHRLVRKVVHKKENYISNSMLCYRYRKQMHEYRLIWLNYLQQAIEKELQDAAD